MRVLDREQMRALREAERTRRAYERAVAADEKERKRSHIESRVAEVEGMNAELDGFVASLEPRPLPPRVSREAERSVPLRSDESGHSTERGPESSVESRPHRP